MKNLIIRFIFTIGAIMLMHEYSYCQFSLQGELRPRFEYRNGYKRLPDTITEFAAFVSQRSRLTFNFKSEKVTTKISFQDVAIWGSERFKSDTADLGIHEAWAEFPICDSLSLKVGKQEIIYDNERLFSNGNWSQLGYTHDAAMLKYRKNGLQIDFTGAFNQGKENLFGTDYSMYPNNYKTLNVLWISKKFTDRFKVSLLGVADGFQKLHTENTVYVRATYGGIINYTKENKYSAILRGFYQSGKLQTGKQIAAFYLSADISYTIALKFTIWAGMQVSSGNNGPEAIQNKSHVFNTLYGSGHKFSGNMDYFSSIAADTKGAGLVDPYLNLIYKFSDKAFARLDLHYLALQNNYIVNTAPINKTLGGEADLSFTYNINSVFSLMAGFSGNLATTSMEVIVGGNSVYAGGWGFVMLTIKPTFFSWKMKNE